MSTAQLALLFPVRRACTFDTFEAAGNAELVARLRTVGNDRRFATVWVVGVPGSGKSHLLQASCTAVGSAGGTAAYLPAEAGAAAGTALDGLEGFDLVAIDDVERWIGDAAREAALLALYQGLAARQRALVVASATPVSATPFLLADLASRLRAAEVFAIAPLDDAARVRLLERRAGDRGLALEPEVAAYLLKRAPRSPGALCDLLEALDRASLETGRALSIPLVRAVLESQGAS